MLVANAGITDDTLLLRMSEESFASVVDANLTGAYRVAKRAASGMLRARSGRMIFISSVVALVGSPGQANYAASKAGLIGLARSIARELGSRSITANVIAPGFIETDMTAELTEARKSEVLAGVPLRRYGTVEEVAAAAMYLASPAAAYVTGVVLPGRRRNRNGNLMGLLDGKRLLITGVITDASIAFSVARLAQEQGARSCSPASAGCRSWSGSRRKLPEPAAGGRARRRPTRSIWPGWPSAVREHVDGLDGVLHSIGFAPAVDCLGGGFLDAPWDDVGDRGAGVGLLAEVARRGDRCRCSATAADRSSGSTFDARWPGRPTTGWAWPRPALESTSRYLARDLGPRGIRVNLIAAGPMRTMAAKSIPGFSDVRGRVGRPRAARLGQHRRRARRAQRSLALLSDWFPATTGEMVHVDGGFHAVGV